MIHDSGDVGHFDLHGAPRAIELTPDGLIHPTRARGRGRTFSPYAEITHLASSQRSVWIGTRRSVYVIARAAFVDEHGPEHLVRALLTRVSRLPDGAERLARMARIEEASRAYRPLRTVWVVAAACLVVFALQLTLGPKVSDVGAYVPILVLDGDLWRVLTANLVHGLPEVPIHLALNLLALFAVGFLAERPLGAARTGVVLGTSAVGAMLANGLVDAGPVVGASGMIFGLLGAVLWLELRCADQLPAWWRIPRRVLWTLLGINAVLPFLLPIIAWGAHLGGLLTGMFVTALLVPRRLPQGGSPAWLRAAAAALAVAALVSIEEAGRELYAEGDYAARHAARMARLPDVPPGILNNLAWTIAIDPESTTPRLEAALQLAERAVLETDRAQPELLDTLAELQFLLGQTHRAVATIDEAIAQAPQEDYYREQRRRFLGERARDDRPEAPLVPSMPREGPSAPDEEPPGLTV